MNANELAGKAEDKTRELQQSAGKLKDKAQDWGEKATKKAKRTARDAAAAADSYVHEYAWTTFALVAVTALTIGFFLGRGRD